MVIGIGGQPRLELAELTLGAAAFLGERQRAAGAGDFGMVGDLRRDLGQRRMRFLLAAEGDQRAQQSAPGVRVLRLLFQQRAEQFGRVIRLSLVQRGARLGEQVGAGHAAAPELQQRLDEAFDLGLRQRALKHVGDLALPECGDRGHRLQREPDLRELAHQRLIFVDIDLDQLHTAAGAAHHTLEHWSQRLAWAAPGRPEIDDDRDRAGGLDHVGHERGLAAIDDRRVGRHWSGAG